jgi:16S rRNA (cytosine1402-N4)-methyltransferase
VRSQTARRHVDGVLFDLGVSSPQLDDPARGFSFSKDGPLDMRMDTTRGEPVSAWLARAGLDEIRQVIATLGEERFARRVAQAIVAARGEAVLSGTGQLATVVAGAVRTREPGKHPATRTFQALRMHINDELGQLGAGLSGALGVLSPGARLAVISFHSLEDRAVKQFMQRESQVDPALKRLPVVPVSAQPKLKLVGRKSRPAAAELERNPRSRSALLRVAERLP